MNLEVRERLPEWLHDTLPAGERAVVDAHLATCAECAAELEVLRVALATMRARPVPRIDTRSIVAALPSSARARTAPRRSFASQWRFAAAITVVALGGMSLAVVRQYFGQVPTVDTLAAVPPSSIPVAPVTPQVDTPAAVRPVGLTAGGGVSDLGDDDLETLIGALDRLEAAPHVEPDTSTFIRIVSGATGGN
jgi:anti-sigma factor RsiW